MSNNISTYWERKNGDETFHIHISATQVTFGSHFGSGQSDNAGTVTHWKFLQGHYSLAQRTPGL